MDKSKSSSIIEDELKRSVRFTNDHISSMPEEAQEKLPNGLQEKVSDEVPPSHSSSPHSLPELLGLPPSPSLPLGQAGHIPDQKGPHAHTKDFIVPSPAPTVQGLQSLQYLSQACGFEELSSRAQKALYDCSRGEHPAVWYKFKRFETLNLLNLYHYQHQLVLLEEKIARTVPPGAMSANELERLRVLMKDYQEALHRFAKTSKMKRPTMPERRNTVAQMSSLLIPRYSTAPDALGMVDLTPQALGVEPDSIRLFLSRTFHEQEKSRRTQTTSYAVFEADRDSGGQEKRGVRFAAAAIWDVFDTIKSFAYRSCGISEDRSSDPAEERTPGGEKAQPKVLFEGRPFAIHISSAVDTLARLTIAIISGLFLLIPMISLSYIKGKGYRLLTTCLFVLVFAVVLSLSSRATNQEIVMATATYSAVLVVFVGQTT